MALLKFATRIWSILLKELVEVIRRPGALLSLILGPFLILAIFGVGYNGQRRPLDTVLVIPPEPALPQDAASYEEMAGDGFRVVAVTNEAGPAMDALKAQQVDLVVNVPPGIEANLRAGRQSTIEVSYNLINPVEIGYALFLSERLSAEVNKTIVARAITQLNEQVAKAAPGAGDIPPEVAAEPTVVTTNDVAQSSPNVISYFGPAVLALILQHMAVTLTALSLVRERQSGVMELFRISPVGALELLIGKYVAFGVLSALIGAVVVALLVVAFQVPFLAPVATVAGVVALLVLASLGLGLFISVIADSERQAVQLSLLVLLASVFFSGFVLAIDQFAPPVRALAYALPVTHGIRLIQDLLLRGDTVAWWEAGALGVIAAALFVVTWLLLRRAMSR